MALTSFCQVHKLLRVITFKCTFFWGDTGNISGLGYDKRLFKGMLGASNPGSWKSLRKFMIQTDTKRNA